MAFYYMVIEILNGEKQKPVVMTDKELETKIDSVGIRLGTEQHSIITEKNRWYRIDYGDSKNFLKYKSIK